MKQPSKNRTILILETDPDFAKDMAAILRRDFLIHVITNPRELIEEDGSRQIDLMVAALDFPGLVQAICFKQAEESSPLDKLLHQLINQNTPVLILGSEGLKDPRPSRFEGTNRYPDPVRLMTKIRSLFNPPATTLPEGANAESAPPPHS
ncbi:MAG: hypothetical protein KJ970_15730 [Candidatus Eisenbacteria bacterium]|uniref:Response regulatory domain-containing protein n=1 Tax=Eiseniibacteriota bacterium TaxID=2212470 RepID=A0A948RWM0_UNCEI|nr:hypothetical protein [Candidatus Eisenbacteria bacterium]